MTFPSWLEISAIVMTTICIFLAGRNNVHTWWTGIVACILYGSLFYSIKLYADTLLQAFFIGTSIYGWYHWKKKEPGPIKGLNAMQMACLVGIGLMVVVAYGGFLHHFTDAYAPFWDSAVLAFSAIGQILLMSRYIQNWPAWVVVNIISVPLYWSKELYLSSILYSIYLVHAVWAWKNWLDIFDNATPHHENDIGGAVKYSD